MNVLKWFEEHAQLVLSEDEFVWNSNRMSFDVPSGLPKDKAVYAIVSQDGIEKVGKADGNVAGFRARMSNYKDTATRCRPGIKYPDATAIHITETMESTLKDVKLKVFAYFVPQTETTIDDLTVTVSPAREIEALLSKAAFESNEPMRLAKLV